MSALEDTIRAVVAVERQAMAERIEELVSGFWEIHREVRATQPMSRWGRLGVRLQVRNGVPRVEWYQLIFKGPFGKRRPTSRHFGRGGRLQYARGLVRGFARDWELELFDELEPQFAEMRQKLRYLTTICQYVKLIRLHDARTAAPKEASPGQRPAPAEADRDAYADDEDIEAFLLGREPDDIA